MPRLRVHHLVVLEFRKIHAWYAGLSPLASENFIRSFEHALRHLNTRRMACSFWRAPFRRARLKGFPYLLLFLANRRETFVLALVHERREPGATLDMLLDRQR